jgi:hypothetical protein
MSILNRDMTNPDRSFRDKLKPLDKTGHKMSNGKFSIKVVKTGDTKENDYLRIANEYLEDRGYKTKLYKINERREEEAKNFADKNFDSVSFMGYGFNELAPESFKGEFKIRSGEDFDEAMKIISQKYKVDTYNSKDEKEKDSWWR